jgi:hypothetical protein
VKALILALVLGVAGSHLRADEGADVPLRPFKVCAQQFLQAIAAEDYDRAFEMLDRADIRIAVWRKQGEEGALLAKKKQRFLDDAKSFTGLASWVLASGSELMAIRHDDANVTVWVPVKDGKVVVELREFKNGQIVIGSFAARDDSVSKGPGLR